MHKWAQNKWAHGGAELTISQSWEQAGKICISCQQIYPKAASNCNLCGCISWGMYKFKKQNQTKKIKLHLKKKNIASHPVWPLFLLNVNSNKSLDGDLYSTQVILSVSLPFQVLNIRHICVVTQYSNTAMYVHSVRERVCKGSFIYSTLQCWWICWDWFNQSKMTDSSTKNVVSQTGDRDDLSLTHTSTHAPPLL